MVAKESLLVFSSLGRSRAGVKLLTFLAAKMEPLPMKRDLQSVMLRYESTALRVLNEKHPLLRVTFFFVWTRQGQEEKKPPHAVDQYPDEDNQRQKA
jgi:hypothetical protein